MVTDDPCSSGSGWFTYLHKPVDLGTCTCLDSFSFTRRCFLFKLLPNKTCILVVTICGFPVVSQVKYKCKITSAAEVLATWCTGHSSRSYDEAQGWGIESNTRNKCDRASAWGFKAHHIVAAAQSQCEELCSTDSWREVLTTAS